MILYIDCAAGLSGDMLLAGWVDLGLPLLKVEQLLGRLGIWGVKLRAKKIKQPGGFATRLSIQSSVRPGVLPSQSGKLLDWIGDSALSEGMKRSLTRTLTLLARAEGKVHGVGFRQVAFHQLADVDTIVDVAGFCLGLSHFKISSVYASAVPIGSLYQGHSGRWHRRPGPAVCELLKGVASYQRSEQFEWSTPTGAVLLRAFGCAGSPPPFKVSKAGYALGSRRPPSGPTVLRMLLGKHLSS
jgi:pyridinium-3,5-bisthiocarboxylic acid mononucleotide nickel chelatase